MTTLPLPIIGVVARLLPTPLAEGWAGLGRGRGLALLVAHVGDDAAFDTGCSVDFSIDLTDIVEILRQNQVALRPDDGRYGEAASGTPRVSGFSAFDHPYFY